MKQQDMHEQGGTRPAGTKGALNDGLPVVPDNKEECKNRMKPAEEGIDLHDTAIMQQQLLAMLLMNPDMASHCSEDWFDGARQRIFRLIRHLVYSRLPVSVSSLSAELSEQDWSVLHSIVELNAGKKMIVFSNHNVGLAADLLQKEFFIQKCHECLCSLEEAIERHDLEGINRTLDTLQGLKSAACPTEGFRYFGTDTDLPRPTCPITIQGIPCFEAQNFYVIMGEEKSGKSHFHSVLLHALLYRESPEFQIKSNLPPGAPILYIDTEQSLSAAQDICRTANLMAHRPYNAPCPNLFIASTDGMSAEETIRNIEKSVRELRPAVVFIDGYAGLFDDNYQNKGVEATMKKVRAIAREYNTTIIGIWHTVENAITGRTTAFGAAGKLSQKYGGGTILVTSSSSIINIKHLQSRSLKFSPFSMRLQNTVVVGNLEESRTMVCENGDIEALLAPMGKSINDRDVRLFAVPRFVSPLEADSIMRKQKEADRAEARQRKDMANEEDYRAQMLKIFGTSFDLPLSRDEMRNKYTKFIWREAHELSEADVPSLSKTQQNSRSQAFKRLVDASLRLGIIVPTPHDNEKFHYVHKA